MADLIVELYGMRIGVLAGPWRTFDFLPDPIAVAELGIDNPILSVAIPLTVVLNGAINPGRVFDYETDLEHIADAYLAMDERRAIKSLIRVAAA